VDGTQGEVILSPRPGDAEGFRSDRRGQTGHGHSGSRRRDHSVGTTDGVHVHLAANVECLPEIVTALDWGAESIGLFRTEFLYLERADFPTEEQQYQMRSPS
jgi:phosphotransferase system enzyme I (PtsI)